MDEMDATHDVKEKKNAYTVLVGKPDGKRTFGRHRCRMEDNIKLDPKRDGKVWTEGMWLRTGRSARLVDMVMNLRSP